MRERKREKETAGRRFQRPAGANLDANGGTSPTSPTPSPPLLDPRHHDEDDHDHDDHVDDDDDDDDDDDHDDDVDKCKNTSSVGIVASSRLGGGKRCSSVAKLHERPIRPLLLLFLSSPFAFVCLLRTHIHTQTFGIVQLNFPMFPGHVNNVMFCSGIIMNRGLMRRRTVPASLYYPLEKPNKPPPIRFVESIVKMGKGNGVWFYGSYRIHVISIRVL